MNDHPEDQKCIEESTPNTTKPQLFKEVGDLARYTIDRVIPQIEKCMQDQKHGPEEVPYLNRVSDMLDTLQKCCRNLEILIQIETDAVGFRKVLEKEIENEAQKNS